MSERQKPEREKPKGIGGGDPVDFTPLSSDDDEGVDTSRNATVAHGPYAEIVPVAGQSVESIRKRFRTRMNIDPNAEAFVNGQRVGNDHKVGANEVLMFTKRAGEKGGF